MEWKWTSNGLYSASSVYRIMIGGGKIEAVHHKIWKFPAPPTVRIFGYLLLRRKILTQDVIQKRNMGVDVGCRMCQQCPYESALHLIFICPDAVQVWREIAVKIGYRLMVPASTVEEVWLESKKRAKIRGKNCYKEWSSLFLCACWHIWKRRNEKNFSGRITQSRVLADKIIEESRLWLKFCNTGTTRLMGHNLRPDPD